MVACVTHVVLVVTHGCMCDTRCIGSYKCLHVLHALYWLLQMVASVTHVVLVVTNSCMCDTRCIGCYKWLHV